MRTPVMIHQPRSEITEKTFQGAFPGIAAALPLDKCLAGEEHARVPPPRCSRTVHGIVDVSRSPPNPVPAANSSSRAGLHACVSLRRETRIGRLWMVSLEC